jgi:hypothetical protein
MNGKGWVGFPRSILLRFVFGLWKTSENLWSRQHNREHVDNLTLHDICGE